MGVLSSTLRVSLKDLASGPARRITSALAGLRRAGNGMTVGNQMAAQRRKMGRAARGMSTGVSLPLLLIGGAGFKAAYGLEKMMNKVQAVGRLTDEQRGGIAKYSQELNGLFPFTNKEIAGAALELLRAGFTYKKVIGALKDTLSLAMAGDIDRSEAADIQTNVLTAMRLRMDTQQETARSAKRVADVLSYAANSSNTDVQKLGQTFKFVGPIAAAAGASIEKVAAMAMIMANNGIKSSEAGVAMRSGLIRMVKPTTAMLDALAGINVNLNDFVGGARAVSTSDIFAGLSSLDLDTKILRKPLEKLLNDPALAKSPARLVGKMTKLIAQSLGDTSVLSKEKIAKTLSETLTLAGTELDLSGFIKAISRKVGTGPEALKIFSKIFDARQVGRLLTLMLGDVDKITADIVRKSGGYANKAAAQMQKGIVGQVAKIKASWENLFVSIGKAGVLKDVGEALESVTNGLKSLAETNPQSLKLGTYFVGALAIAGPLGILLTGIGSTLAAVAAGAELAASALSLILLRAPLAVATLAVDGAIAVWSGTARAIKNAAWALFTFNGASVKGAMVSALLAPWRGVTAAIKSARRAQIAFFMMSAAGGKGFAFKTMGGALLGLLKPVRLVTAAMHVLKLAVIGTGIGAIILGIAGAGTFIYNNWQGIKEMFSGIGEGFREALGPTTMAIFDKVGAGISKVVGFLTDLVGPLDASKEQWRNWGKGIGAALAWPVKMLAKIADFIIPDWLKTVASWAGSKIGDMLGMKKGEAAEKPATKAAAALAPEAKPAPAKAAVAAMSPPATPGTGAAIASLSQVGAKATGTVGVVQNAMSQIKSAANLDLTAQGMKIMDTLAAGMRSRAGAAVAEMRNTAQQLRDHLPSSPAKTGPLSDLHKLKFGETIARSIKAGPMVAAMRKASAQTRAAAGQAGAIRVQPLAGMGRAAAAGLAGAGMMMGGAGGNSVGDVHVSVTINGGVSDNASIGDEIGRKVRAAVSESYSDGGI